MKPLSIRNSLTIWFVGSTGLLLIAFSATLYLGMRETLLTELDARLQTRAESLFALCEWEEDLDPPIEFEMADQLVAELVADGGARGVEVRMWPGGELVRAAGVPLGPPPAVVARGVTVEFGARALAVDLRVCALLRPVAVPAGSSVAPEVLVRVAESFAPVRERLDRTAWVILLLTLVAAGCVAAFGLLVARRIVHPLRLLGSAAAAAGGGALLPMPRRGNDDEVDHLATILDGTFASLRGAVARNTRFTADAAHELRNPISVIRSSAEVALRDGRSAQEMRDFLVDIRETAKRIGEVVESLLMLARLDAKAVEMAAADVDVAEVARDSIAAATEGRNRLSLFTTGPTVVHGVDGLLRVLVDNLIANALRHSAGACVEITVRGEPDGRVHLEVRDHGPGVPPGTREAVFERFYRVAAAASDRGAGLGLAIVAEVADAHRASYRIDDARPGARVCVVFDGPTQGNGPSSGRSHDALHERGGGPA